MYKYCVEVFDKVFDEDTKLSFNLMLYRTVTADGYCAELEARKKYPNCKIGEVTRISDFIENV